MRYEVNLCLFIKHIHEIKQCAFAECRLLNCADLLNTANYLITLLAYISKSGNKIDNILGE
jgi:hypothetical protein